tara:strand:+ start:135749 stop:136939 length:1191 start_codon:yes stop_codon:yes gene_type:complete
MVSTFILVSSQAFGYSFSEAVKRIETHEAVESLNQMAGALTEKGSVNGSWGDPMIKLAAKNFPKDSLKDDETPMTGIEVGLSQKVALTTKYGNTQDAFESLGQAKRHEAGDKKKSLVVSFWKIVIEQKRLGEEIQIFSENLAWVTKILKVSKKLYSNGKISQQALLDIQIRKSEIEAGLSNKEFELKESQSRLGYLLDLEGELDLQTVPWRLVEGPNTEKIDLKELSLESKLKASKHMVTAAKQSFVPDMTFSVGYTKRSNIDNRGDFVSAAVVFPLPISGKKYAGHSKAVHERAAAESLLRNYRRMKNSRERALEHSISRIENELKILNQKTIKFAENSRKVTSKSYGYGRSSYVELLQSELKLQSLLLKRSRLDANLIIKKLEKRYLVGERLYE